MGKRGNKEYFKEAARKSRRKRKIEEEKLLQRNSYLEQVVNPQLKDVCDRLTLELQYLKRTKQQKQQKQNLNIIGPFLDFEKDENYILKEKLKYYRDCQTELAMFLKSLNQRMSFKTESYQVQANFSKILNRVLSLKNLNFNTFNNDHSFYSKYKKQIKVHSYLNELYNKGKYKKSIRIEIKDIPLSVDKVFKTYSQFYDDENAFLSLLKAWQPNRSNDFAKINKNTVLQTNKCKLTSTTMASTEVYKVSGMQETNTLGKKGYVVTYSMMSDYKQKLDDLSIKDPYNVVAYIIEEGKSKEFCDITAVSEYHDTIDYDLYGTGNQRGANELMKVFVTGLDADFFKVFITRSLLVNETC